MIVIGLTGNYGMGKSTVAKMFGELGAVIINTDDIVNEFLRDNAVINEIKKTFGNEIAENGDLNKQMLADIVFGNPILRKALEDILHPKVFRKIDEDLVKISRGSSRIVIVEAPVIFERGYQNRFDKIITVFTAEETAVSRLMEKGISGEKAAERLKSQFPVEMKKAKSDFVIDNGGDIEKTRRQVEEIYNYLLTEKKEHGYN